ncbi:MAG TPA: carbohydrate binding family 9 domain-containing protein, partial [Gemmatimonadaceae bacterium]|nr:carbohydrate binding family 9 domain-containing protein [Gemmatimonadaceae bacterium]
MRGVLSAFLTLFAASTLGAQQPVPRPASAHEHDAPRATATRITGVMHIDGVLNEPQWRTAEPVTRFTQLDPQEGKPASERTDVRFLFDDDALYIGAMMHDRSPVSARLGRRDMSMSASDWLTVILDPSHDHRTAVGFEVNPLGVRRDQTRSPSNEDDSWEPVWQATAAVTDSGWTAEIRIPFSQLRFTGKSDLVWGLQIERQIARNQEFANWAFTPREQPGGIPRFGHLVGLTGLASGKKLEIMPYVVTRSENINRAGNPFRDDHELH